MINLISFITYQIDLKMGSSQQAIKAAIIDRRAQPQDFVAITDNKLFACNYYDNYDKFLENQSLKELSYIIIRESKEKIKQQQRFEEKIKESSVVSKTYQNMEQLRRQFESDGKKDKREQLLRERLIAYIRKYSLQRLVIYLLVDNVLDFKIPQYEQPYITLVADKIEVIKNHLQQRPKGAEPLNFKFRRMMKDLYRRTVVKILSTETHKDLAKKQKEEWAKCLGSSISSSISPFNQQQFQQNLMSSYYEYIIVSNSASLSFIQDMKRKHKFQSLLIYYGKIEDYGRQQYKNQTQQKLIQVKKSLWMFSQNMNEICQAIRNCTDIIAEETSVKAKNVVIFTHLNYGTENQNLFMNKLKQFLNSPSELKNAKGADIIEKQWMKNLSFKVCSTFEKLKEEIKKVTFSYLITFDCTVNQIEGVKAFLRQEKLHKRAYMYNAEEKESSLSQIEYNLSNKVKVQEYLTLRAKKTLEKAGFIIKFEIGPIDEISTYKASQKELVYLKYELGLQTENIENMAVFQKYYMSVNRQRIILGNTLIIKVRDYFKQFKELVLKDQTQDSTSYLRKINIIILDDARIIREYWDSLQHQIKEERIVFVHYNLLRISQFLDILYVPGINLSIFVKKALPNFYKAYQKLEENKFKRVEITGQIVSKNQLLKQVFGDQNFKLSTQYQISFLKLANSNTNLEQALIVLHQEFLAKYGLMWRPGYQIVSFENRKRCIQTLKDDLKACLFKCKSYQLLEVSQEQFEYFYLKRLQQCQTYLDLQITIVYMFSLPHGLSNVIQLIFSQCLSTCLSPKTFAGLIVLLLSAFCSFQDEVMNKKRFVIYLDDTNNENFHSIISALKIGDILFNSCFIMSGKDEDSFQNIKNNCIFLEFEDIPMLSQTHIKNYLYIQRFSFYKESTEYLIAPYTQFTVKNIDFSSLGKTHITLVATTDSRKGFVSKVFDANNIKQKQLFKCIISQLSRANNGFSEQESKRIKETGSLYKKAELIGLYEQKIQLIKSIREGLEYNNFLISARAKKYMTALSQIRRKESQQKSTTQIQAAYFKRMLGVQKAMLYYNLCEYDMSIKELDKVIQYLQEQNVEEGQNWVIKKVKAYKQTVNDLNTKRHKYLNRAEKTKYWKIQPEIIQKKQPNQSNQSVKLGVKMSAQTMKWNVGYDAQLEQFYIRNERGEQFVHYNTKPAFGELATAFPPKSSYQNISERKVDQKEQIINKFLQMQTATWQDGKKQKNKKQVKESTKQQEVQNKNKKQNSKTKLPQPDLNLQRESPSSNRKQNFNEQKSKQLKIASPQKSQREKPIFVQSPSKLSQASKLSILRQKQTEVFLSESDIKMGIREQLEWQAFYFNDKYLLTQKGKHYKTKIPNKYNL